MPKPRVREIAKTRIVFESKPISATICMPMTAIEPNKMSMQPPRTGSGIVINKLAIGGKRLAMTKNKAPIKIVNRLTTFVWATMPTFCEKVVSGNEPNKAPTMLLAASAVIAPAISRSLGSRPDPCGPRSSYRRCTRPMRRCKKC